MADGLTLIDPQRPGTPSPGGAVLTRVRNLAAQPAVARSLPLLGLAALALAALLAWNVLTAGPQRELFAGLADADKAAVAQALDAGNVAYKIDSGTGSLRVSSDDYHKARMMLAAQGLPKTAPAGVDPTASMPMGASEAVEREHLQGAREADLARTIEAIDAVGSAPRASCRGGAQPVRARPQGSARIGDGDAASGAFAVRRPGRRNHAPRFRIGPRPVCRGCRGHRSGRPPAERSRWRRQWIKQAARYPAQGRSPLS